MLKTIHVFFYFLFFTNARGQAILNQTEVVNYSNTVYHFAVSVPGNWKLYGEIVNDSIHHFAIVDWGLPEIYSDSEQTNIENSISITAYQLPGINSVAELIKHEYLRINPVTTALEIDPSNENARIIYSTAPNGTKYKGKSYYIYLNGIGYVVTFMATPGTYYKNIAVFEQFFGSINFK